MLVCIRHRLSSGGASSGGLSAAPEAISASMLSKGSLSGSAGASSSSFIAWIPTVVSETRPGCAKSQWGQFTDGGGGSSTSKPFQQLTQMISGTRPLSPHRGVLPPRETISSMGPGGRQSHPVTS